MDEPQNRQVGPDAKRGDDLPPMPLKSREAQQLLKGAIALKPSNLLMAAGFSAREGGIHWDRAGDGRMVGNEQVSIIRTRRPQWNGYSAVIHYLVSWPVILDYNQRLGGPEAVQRGRFQISTAMGNLLADRLPYEVYLVPDSTASGVSEALGEFLELAVLPFGEKARFLHNAVADGTFLDPWLCGAGRAWFAPLAVALSGDLKQWEQTIASVVENVGRNERDDWDRWLVRIRSEVLALDR